MARPAGSVSGRAITERGYRAAGAASPVGAVVDVVAPAPGSGVAGSAVEARRVDCGVGSSRLAVSSADAPAGSAIASNRVSEIVVIAVWGGLRRIMGVTASTSGHFVNVANRYLLEQA